MATNYPLPYGSCDSRIWAAGGWTGM